MINPVSSAVPDTIVQALQTASAATGASFDYLLTTARRESSLNPAAKAPGTSASGLFQFIDRTWLQLIKEEGARFGLGDLADKIERRGSGYAVADERARAAILSLRHDPTVSAEMAGVFTARNADFLSGRIGRRPTDGELYVAHFLGAAGAARLIELRHADPDANAARLFPAEAATNRAIFYDRTGAPRSVDQVYAVLTRSRGPAPATASAKPQSVPSMPGAVSQSAAAPVARGAGAPFALGYAVEPARGPGAMISAVLAPAAPAPRSRFAPLAQPAERGVETAATLPANPRAVPRSRFAPALG